MPKKEEERYDWVEALTKAAGTLGFNEVRVRWKLRAWQDRMSGRGRVAKTRAESVTRAHKVCPRCGGINNLDQKECLHCGARLHSRQVDMTIRFLKQFGVGVTPESFIVAVLIGVYIVTIFMGPNSGVMNSSGRDLFMMGGNFPPATLQGQWWRLWTAVLLHAGIWHIGFNVYATLFITPVVREVFGPNKTLFVFVVTGVLASAVSLAWGFLTGRYAVSIGASGAISGFIGLMIAWGHRDGTAYGIGLRNHLARWVLYILIFGFFFHADNAAHIGGLLAGAALAYLIPSNLNLRESRAWPILGALCAAAILGGAALIMYLAFNIPPPGQ